MRQLANGSLFAVPLPDGTFVSGRVMLDIYGCLKRRLLPGDSPLAGAGKAHLVEMYSAITRDAAYEPSPIMIPGAIVSSDEMGTKWPIIGRIEVDPQTVEFPEAVLGRMHPGGECAFYCGEMRVLLPLPLKTAEMISEFARTHSSMLWPFTCLRMLGREGEIPGDYKMATLSGGDLRYSQYRNMIYEHLPFPVSLPHFEKQKAMGLHLERLYG